MRRIDMIRKKLLRRAGILCWHFLRNLAFYKAGFRNGKLVANDQFFVSANGNFLDICILEWCKLFGDKNEKHYWRKVVADPDRFMSCLLQSLSLTQADFDAYIKTVRDYRDKFVAHLDKENTMRPPKLRIARKSASFLYGYLLDHEQVEDCYDDAPKNVPRRYKHYLRLGRKCYPR